MNRVVLRRVTIGLLLLGMALSNLTPLLGSAVGQPFRWLGMRQYWSMFAPNPVHEAHFVTATATTSTGELNLDIAAEPPASGWFFELGYDRIHKLHKQVALQPERYASAYAEALCRTHAIEGSVSLFDIVRTPPGPRKRLEGAEPVRSVSPLGTWPCP